MKSKIKAQIEFCAIAARWQYLNLFANSFFDKRNGIRANNH